MKSFPHALMSVPTLVLDGKQSSFIQLMALLLLLLQYRNPLLIGKLEDGMYRVKVHTTPKTYAKAASGPPAPLHPKLVAKAQLHLERFGYPSPDRIIVLANLQPGFTANSIQGSVSCR